MTRIYLAKLTQAEKLAKKSIFKLLFMVLVKVIAGTLTGMAILHTSALKSFTTILSIFAAYIGIKASQKSADKHFEYGYYKVETFAAFVASLLVLYVGMKILEENIDHILNPSDYTYGIFGVLILIVTVGFSGKFFDKLEKMGKEANIASLSVTAKYKNIDLLASIAIVVGAVTVLFGIPYVEPVISASIAVAIVIISIKTVKNSLFSLLDYWPDTALLNKIKAVLLGDPHIVKRVASVKLRQAGPLIFGEAVIEINPFANIKDVRNAVKNIRREVTKLSPYLADFNVFSKLNFPPKTIIAIPVKKNAGTTSPLAHTWSEVKHIILVEIRNSKMKIKETISGFDFANDQSLVAELVKQKVNVFVSCSINSLMYYSLERVNQIQVYPAFDNAKTLEEAVKMFTIDS